MTSELWFMIYKVAMIVVLVALVSFVFYQHWRRIQRRAESLEAPVSRVPCQYNVRLDSPRGAFILGADAPLGKLVIGGWTIDGRWADGDYLIIFRGTEGQHTRYRIDKLRIHGSSGFWTADCTFSPRGALGAVRVHE